MVDKVTRKFSFPNQERHISIPDDTFGRQNNDSRQKADLVRNRGNKNVICWEALLGRDDIYFVLIFK